MSSRLQPPETASAPFHVMSKPIGPICNLDCTYCFYLEKRRLYPPGERYRMRDDVLEAYIRQYIEAQPTREVSFAWQGGEPTLMGVEFFEKAIRFQQEYGAGRRIDNSLQTNATLLDDEWCRFLGKHRFLVGVSIDGPRELHDGFRLDRKQEPTFTRVTKGIELLEKHRVEFNTLTVLHRENTKQPLSVYRFLKRIGSRYMQLIPIVEREADRVAREQNLDLALPPLARTPCDDLAETRVTEWSVDPADLGDFLVRVFDEWVRKDVGRYYVRDFDVALGQWMGMQAAMCVFARTCGRAMAIEHDGSVYACDHYVYPDYRVGNVMEEHLARIVDSPRQQRFGSDKTDALPAYCRSCEFRFACNGACPKHRFEYTADGEYGLNYLCPAYKRFFAHVAPYMEEMANLLRARRPPAEIMDSVERIRHD